MNITHSVGIGGVNNRDDVIAVQTALNALCDSLPSMNKLAVDGLLGKRRQAQIRLRLSNYSSATLWV
ncbi:hypothetical protein [Pseudoalteromonas sp. GB56]